MYSTSNMGRIAVLAGGPSNERTISLKSGLAVYDALKRSGRDVRLFKLGDSGIAQLLKSERFDIAFIALHGAFGEDGTVQKILEKLSKPYTGSGPIASKQAFDKIATRKIFRDRKIPFPDYRVLEKKTVKVPDGFSFPLVVKPSSEGSSIGISLCKDKRSFVRACKKAFSYSDKIIVERFIRAREITVGIFGDRTLPVIEIVTQNGFYDFNAKYKDMRTEYLVPAKIPKEVYKKSQTLAKSAHIALGLSDISRVDMLVDNLDNIYVLEANSIPGLTERSLFPKAAKAIGIDFDRLCLEMVKLAVDNSGKKL